MMQVVLHQFPKAQVKYQFINRSSHVDLRPYYEEIDEAIDHLCTLRFTEAELSYLKSLRFMQSDFVDFLRLFQFDRRYVTLEKGESNLSLTIEGPWLYTILFEIPLLAIISEIYSRHVNLDPLSEGRTRLQGKIGLIAESMEGESRFKISDFGTRRRFSFAWQEEVLQTFLEKIPQHVAGTSNVWYAKKFGITPLGTMAHEYIQAHQALGSRLIDSQKVAFENWAKEYRGDLGIALTDTYGLRPFLKDFDLYFCKLFDGVRHDSGDPFSFGDRIIAHYEKHRVDARTKTLIFSDGLNIKLTIELFHYFKDRIQVAFGVGTKLTNDLSHEPLNIVIKMVECNGQAVAKISDEPSKTICLDPDYLHYVKHVFNIH
jgi:nicotinate phosphoribosyltransferase